MNGGDWANVGVAVGTVALAATTAWMASKTRSMADATGDAVEVSREELRLAANALAVTQNQTREAIRARVDARAPRVVVALQPRGWPPFSEPPWQSSAMPNGTTRPARQLVPGDRFVYPQDAGRRIWFSNELIVRNDGATTAFINPQKSEHEDRVMFRSGGVLMGGARADSILARYTLAPGAEGIIEAVTSRTVEQMVNAWGNWTGVWAPGATMHVRLTVLDQFEDGTTDGIDVELISYALRPVEGNAGGWEVRAIEDSMTDSAPTIGGGISVTKRLYRGELDDNDAK
jgi:hypothetical protein